MNAAIVHRGPDHGAVAAYGRCVLGYRRLSIIDLQTGDQPVADERGDVVAVFNGELYNFHELRRELEAAGHEIRGTGDSPLIPHAYEEWGLGFAEHLEGMFAIALWDRAARAARPRARPARQEAAALRAPAGWVARLRLGDEGAAAAARALARARPRAARRLPRAAVRASLGPSRREEGAAGLLRRRRGGLGARRALLVAEACAAEGRLGRAGARGGDGGGPAAARRRRAARSAPLGRDRLVDRRRGDGTGPGRAGADVHGRLPGRALRRAPVCPRGGRAVRHAPRGARDRNRARPRPARARLRRAVRRRGGAAASPRLRGDATARHRRARR